MSNPSKRYERLPGSGLKGTGWESFLVGGGKCRLYLAGDHLLQVENQAGFVEVYKRFYFSDIQAVQVRRTRWLLVLSLVLGVLIGGGAISAFEVNLYVTEESIKYPLEIILFLLMAALLYFFVKNLVQGPTCRCFFKTAVQFEQIPSLGRWWRARRVLGRLKLLIEAAQSQPLLQKTDFATKPDAPPSESQSLSPGAQLPAE